MKRIMREDAVLSMERIGIWMDRMRSICQEYSKAESKEVTRAVLQMEEIMLRARDRFGEDQTVCFSCDKVWRGLNFRLEIEAREVNLLALSEDDPGESYSVDILAGMGTGLRSRYAGGKNRVIVELRNPRRKFSLMQQILLAVLLAVVISMLMMQSPTSAAAVNKVLIKPVFEKLIAILGTFATPMIFLSVMLSIVNMGNLSSFGKVGRSLVAGMGKVYLLGAGVTTLILVLIYGLGDSGTSSGGGSGIMTQVVNLILDIIPGNLLQPFSTDNDLQVIVLSVFVGIIGLMAAETIPNVIRICKELNEFLNRVLLLLCKTLPLIVFTGILNLTLSGNLKVLLESWKAVLAFLLTAALTEIYVLIRARLAVGKPIREIVTPQIPSLMINLTTSSQIAALPLTQKCVKEDWKVDSRLADFGIPFGMVIYMPNGAQMMNILVWSTAAMAGIQFDGATAVLLLFVSIMIAVAAPPIPGSAMIVIPIMLTMAGVPKMYFSAALVLASVMGYLLPALNGFILQLEIYITASKADQNR